MGRRCTCRRQDWRSGGCDQHVLRSDLVDEMAAATPNAEALVFCDERLDYAGLKARVDVFARALLAVGIQRGDRVALLVTNRTEWVVGALAAAKIGAPVAAISTFSDLTWSTRWLPPHPTPRPSCFAMSGSITPVSRREWMSLPGPSLPSESSEATASRCWSPTARNGSSVHLPPPRLALSWLRSARSQI